MDSEDREALDAFARARVPALLRFGYALTGSTASAADVVQEALARMGARWAQIARDGGDLEPYARKVMANTWVSWWRRRRLERLTASPPERGHELARRDDTVWAALAELPPRQRAVLVLRYYEDLSEKEIADVLGCAPGTVKSQAARGMRKLHGLLQPDPLEPR